MKPISASLLSIFSLFFLGGALASEFVPIDPQEFPLTANMRPAHRVEILSTRMNPTGVVWISSRRTFDNGAKVDCEQTFGTQKMGDGKTLGLSLRSENCTALVR